VQHLQQFIRGPLNVLPDLMTVRRSIEKGLQDGHVKRSLEAPDSLLRLLHHGRHSTLILAMMAGTRDQGLFVGVSQTAIRSWSADWVPFHLPY
jgi:hypothetical protein